MYLRYIDDIFCIFDQGEDKVLDFLDYINEQHPTIKFTMEYSKEQVNLLDTIVRVDKTAGKLCTEMYTKETHTHNYRHYNSANPEHCKRGGPFGEFLKIRRNWNMIADYVKHSEDRVSDYRRRGYPMNIIRKAQRKARNLNRESLLKPRNKSIENNETTPLVVTFNPANPNFHKILEKHWHILQLSKTRTPFQKDLM